MKKEILIDILWICVLAWIMVGALAGVIGSVSHFKDTPMQEVTR